MKLAYIGTEQVILKTISSLGHYFERVDFYVADDVTESIDMEIEKLPIMVGHLTIPRDAELQTAQHKNISKKIHPAYQGLLNNIYGVKAHFEKTELPTKEIEFSKNKISEINFIKFNREINKYAVENTKQEILEYDHLIIQDNQLIMSLLIDKQQNLFFSFTEQSRVLLTFEFEVSYRYLQSENKKFVFVDNGFLHAIEDNWYFVNLDSHKVSVSLYIPIEMQQSASYLDFLEGRILKLFNHKLDFFQIKQRMKYFLQPVDGYTSYKAKLRFPKQASLMPCFLFWSEEKIKSFVHQNFRSKKNAKVTASGAAERSLS